MEVDQIWNLIAKKLSGEGSEEDIRELEKLLRENPDLHYPLQAITDLWNTDLQVNQNDAHDALMRHIDRMKEQNIDYADRQNEEEILYPEPVVRKRKYFWSLLTGSLVVGAVLIVVKFMGSTEPASKIPAKDGKWVNSQISTKYNSKTSLVLSDGTKVWLNAGSSLSYDSNFNINLREVSLTGEAFFDVTKNKLKPFIIHTSKIDIKVVGTEFNVRSYATDKTTEASLIRGSIEVSFKDNPENKILLRPNEKIVVDNNGKFENVSKNSLLAVNRKISQVPGVAIKNLTYEAKTGTIIETSWVENKLIFQDESFDEIAHQLERWYGVSIVFKNEQLKENHLTGNFTNETVRQALDALKLTAMFRYDIDKNNLITIY
jgi:transmembrane sensor